MFILSLYCLCLTHTQAHILKRVILLVTDIESLKLSLALRFLKPAISIVKFGFVKKHNENVDGLEEKSVVLGTIKNPVFKIRWKKSDVNDEMFILV